MRSILHAVVENARVTGVSDSPALRLDAYIIRAAALFPFERVDVINVATRQRFQTWVEPLAEGSGDVVVHDLAKKGEAIAIVAFAHLHEGQTLTHAPKFVTLDENNHVIRVS